MHNVERNVVYGMYSGLALLMDVYHPEESNGHGIVYINGSGWHSPMAYAAAPTSCLICPRCPSLGSRASCIACATSD